MKIQQFLLFYAIKQEKGLDLKRDFALVSVFFLEVDNFYSISWWGNVWMKKRDNNKKRMRVKNCIKILSYTLKGT